MHCRSFLAQEIASLCIWRWLSLNLLGFIMQPRHYKPEKDSRGWGKHELQTENPEDETPFCTSQTESQEAHHSLEVLIMLLTLQISRFYLSSQWDIWINKMWRQKESLLREKEPRCLYVVSRRRKYTPVPENRSCGFSGLLWYTWKIMSWCQQLHP